MMSVLPRESVRQPVMINREEELAEAIDRVHRMLSGLPVPQNVIFYYGVAGVGKTTLLLEIQRHCAMLGVPTMRVDFDRSAGVSPLGKAQTPDEGLVALVGRLMSDLERVTDFVPKRRIADDLPPDEAAERFFEYIVDFSRIGRERPIGLFFDTVEDSDREAFYWLQERILEPLLNQYPALVVMAGRTRPNTVLFDLLYPIERRTEVIHLAPFGSEETVRQVEALIDDPTGVAVQGQELLGYTGGVPGLNREAALWLRDKQPVTDLRERLVRNVIFGRLASRSAQEVEKELLTVAVLRQFDTGLLRWLMEKVLDYASDGTIRPVRRLLRKLQETTLVEPHPDGYGYTVASDLRSVLDLYWQQEEPLHHLRIHMAAADWFEEQVKQGDFVAIADHLYHVAGQWRDLEENSALREWAELPPTAARKKILVRTLKETLDKLGPNPRAFDLATKIKRVLQEDDFNLVLPNRITMLLIEKCETFTESLA